MKTISWIPYYEDFIDSVIKMTKNKIFLSGLFYDGEIDFEIKVKELLNKKKKDFHFYYNVYSYPNFVRFLKKKKIHRIKSYDFEIKKDLKQNDKNHMGTYTLKLENSRRIQISGTIVMNWKILEITLDN